MARLLGDVRGAAAAFSFAASVADLLIVNMVEFNSVARGSSVSDSHLRLLRDPAVSTFSHTCLRYMLVVTLLSEQQKFAARCLVGGVVQNKDGLGRWQGKAGL